MSTHLNLAAVERSHQVWTAVIALILLVLRVGGVSLPAHLDSYVLGGLAIIFGGSTYIQGQHIAAAASSAKPTNTAPQG